MRIDVAICLPQEAPSVRLVRLAVTRTLEVFGVDEDCIEEIRLALSEACTNVVQHAHEVDEYEVRIEVDDDRCAISVMNTGDELDADELDGVMPGPDSPRGRGVAIMHALMDQVELHSEPAAGTVVRLVKTLTFRPDAPLGTRPRDRL